VASVKRLSMRDLDSSESAAIERRFCEHGDGRAAIANVTACGGFHHSSPLDEHISTARSLILQRALTQRALVPSELRPYDLGQTGPKKLALDSPGGDGRGWPLSTTPSLSFPPISLPHPISSSHNQFTPYTSLEHHSPSTEKCTSDMVP